MQVAWGGFLTRIPWAADACSLLSVFVAAGVALLRLFYDSLGDSNTFLYTFPKANRLLLQFGTGY